LIVDFSAGAEDWVFGGRSQDRQPKADIRSQEFCLSNLFENSIQVAGFLRF
jgi:hypothetical protein